MAKMSVVACKIYPSGYEIGADSITVRGWTQTKGQTTTLSKLFKVNGLVIGGTGTAEENSLMRLFSETHKPSRPDEQSVLEFLSEFSDWKNKRTNKQELGNSFLIGIDNKVFAVEQWLVEEVTSYEAIGAGQDYALAALHLGHDVSQAIGVAIELSVMCEGPIQTIRVGTAGK
jgi:ATP-dependent protease HslVU (ClpYQ) peptidase subunit